MMLSANENKCTEILHSLYLSGRLNDNEAVDYLSSFYGDTYKAYGFIKVSNKKLALKVLKQHFKDINKEYEFDYYPETEDARGSYGFIQDSENFVGGLYLGKFELDIPVYLIKLHKAGVIVENLLISKEDPCFSY